MKPVLSLLLMLWCACASMPAQTPPASEQIGAILKELSGITGLELRRPVEQDIMSRDGLRTFLERRIAEVVKPEEIRADELTLKKFGLVPADFDLKQATVDMMTEQAAAFYDYRNRKMVLLETPGDTMQQVALVHELAHALADQHFGLQRFMNRAGSSDDASLALAAVMEGQATWLMSEYMLRPVGQSLKDSPMLVQAMSRATAASTGSFPVFQSAPLYMRESLLFPYVHGMVFQQEVILKYGQAGFARVFRTPPATTREILHPEVYFAGTKPAAVKLPELTRRQGWKELTGGTLGEFDCMILFRQYAGDAEPLAASWRGGRYRIWEHQPSRRAVLAYATAWESAGKAAEVFRAWQRVLAGKWKSYEAVSADGATVSGRGDDGFFVLRRQANQIVGIEGMASPGDARLPSE